MYGNTGEHRRHGRRYMPLRAARYRRGSGTSRLPLKERLRDVLEVPGARMPARVAYCEVLILAAEFPRFPGLRCTAPG